MNILVTGGAGYIGSHVVRELEQDNKVVVFDNLSKGHRESVSKRSKFIKGDLSNKKLVSKTIKENRIDSVIHLAAFSLVDESVKEPGKYFENNVSNGISLLNAMVENKVRYLVFSSSAAVYGEPEKVPIEEDDPACPTNPYGLTKLIFEQILEWYDKAYGLKYISLRYFNAAGADVSGEIGEDHDQETHLVPIVLQVAQGKREKLEIFGADYKTKDGTCVRDYIHVTDIAKAHVLALKALAKGKESSIYNLGNGVGCSNKEVIRASEKVTGKKIRTAASARREGDPATLIASYKKITKELGWEPGFADLGSIIKTAWLWHSKHPNGFKK